MYILIMYNPRQFLKYVVISNTLFRANEIGGKPKYRQQTERAAHHSNKTFLHTTP